MAAGKYAMLMNYYFENNKNLSPAKNNENNGFDEYVSDPANPVPYTNGIYSRRK